MKHFLLFLSSLLLQGEVATATSSFRYAWGDFTNFNQTSQTSGLIMTTDSPSLVLNENGHIVLNKSTVSFDFNLTPIRPNLSDFKEFSLGLTFEAGSFSSLNGSLSNLFSGQFIDKNNNHLDMDISYNGNQLGGVSFNSEEMAQLTTKIDPSRDLTLFVNQSENNTLSISFYSGTEEITSIRFNNFTLDDGDLLKFVVGDSDSSMILKGMGIMVGESMNESWAADYFRTVEANGSIPEPSSALLTLLGSAALLLRRKRAA